MNAANKMNITTLVVNVDDALTLQNAIAENVNLGVDFFAIGLVLNRIYNLKQNQNFFRRKIWSENMNFEMKM